MSTNLVGVNLDRLCAQYGWEMARNVFAALKKNAENHITKSLGILQEDGVYAFFLYQCSRDDGNLGSQSAKLLADEKIALLPKEILNAETISNNVLDAIRQSGGLADDLDSLLLAKQLLEQALIYARYHAKALKENP